MKPAIFDNRGVPLERQTFTWRDLVQKPISKLDDDAYTRVRIILMNGIEHEAMRFSHACRSPRSGAWSTTRRPWSTG
jgi:hypothetical protein